MADGEEKGLESLIIWQDALKLAVKVCKEIIPLLPIAEQSAMAPQLRRAIQSVPANIAEGYGRYYFQETIRFCYISRGSLLEAYSFIKLAKQLGYLENIEFAPLASEFKNLLLSLNGFILFLKRSKRGANEPGAPSSIKELTPNYEVDDDLMDLFNPELPNTQLPNTQLPNTQLPNTQLPNT